YDRQVLRRYPVRAPRLKGLRTLVELVDDAAVASGQLNGAADDVSSTVSSLSVELTARLTSPSARSSETDRRSSRVRACTSSNRRTFSIAITAWSAKVVTSSICLWVNGCTADRDSTITPIGAPSRSSGTPSIVRMPALKVPGIAYSGSA